MKGVRGFAGVCLVGYGLLVVLRVVAHEALSAGLASLALGALLLWWPGGPARTSRGGSASHPAPPVPPAAPADTPGRGRPGRSGPRGPWVAGLGASTTVGLLAYNLLLGSTVSPPEWGLLVYGVGLVACAPLLSSNRWGPTVGTAIGWSFPLLLAPLSLYAVHAFLAGPSGLGTADVAAPVLHHALTRPTAGLLELLGTPSEVVANNVILATPRGALTLGVGLVCAGIYPTILFVGVLGLHAWRSGLAPGRLCAYVATGFAGLYAANLLRMVLLAKIGQAWGPGALQQAHAHLGWILFAGFMIAFWSLVLRRWERTAPG